MEVQNDFVGCLLDRSQDAIVGWLKSVVGQYSNHDISSHLLTEYFHYFIHEVTYSHLSFQLSTIISHFNHTTQPYYFCNLQAHGPLLLSSQLLHILLF